MIAVAMSASVTGLRHAGCAVNDLGGATSGTAGFMKRNDFRHGLSEAAEANPFTGAAAARRKWDFRACVFVAQLSRCRYAGLSQVTHESTIVQQLNG